MKRPLLVLIAVAVSAGNWLAADAQAAPLMEAEDFWAPPVLALDMTALVYGVLKNGTGHDDMLVAVCTLVAKHAEFKLHLKDNSERTVASIGGLPKDKYLKMKPTEFYIAPGELTGELKSGQSFPMTLQFQGSGPVTVNVKISSDPPPPPPFTYNGGDGSSPEKYIVIHGARDGPEFRAAAEAWLAKNHPDLKLYQLGINVSLDGKMSLVLISGDKMFYFSLSDADFPPIDPNKQKPGHCAGGNCRRCPGG